MPSTSNIKKNKPLDAAALISGAAHVELVRTTTNWGAQWIFNSGALQQDVLAAADAISQVGARTSALDAPSGGFYINSAGGSADTTGTYHVFFSDVAPPVGNALGSGYLHIIPVA